MLAESATKRKGRHSNITAENKRLFELALPKEIQNFQTMREANRKDTCDDFHNRKIQLNHLALDYSFY